MPTSSCACAWGLYEEKHIDYNGSQQVSPLNNEFEPDTAASRLEGLKKLFNAI